jgi:hypothetical protein
MTKFEHFCWVWAFKNGLFGRLSGRATYHRVRLEDLVSPQRSASAWEELWQFLGRHPMGGGTQLIRPRNPSEPGGFPPWRQWNPRRARVLHRHCGELMEQYGYGGEPEWAALLAGSARP